ncbi:MAG: RpiB/LacA/LacB family sugar-phosphate isomerase [Ardenticatenaceae bacterium]|nr:RpiB/LacA/LacB family sugar-phosphate isomerase [Ardenticatenaceae bacterium]
MRIAIGADHAGWALKELLKPELLAAGYEVIDVGAHAYDREDDYPDSAAAVARLVAAGQAEKGILACGSGVGASIAANKVKGARACLCHDIYSAVQGVEHDDMNILCLGGAIVGPALARKLVDGFLAARFLPEVRFRRRLEKVLALEEAV